MKHLHLVAPAGAILAAAALWALIALAQDSAPQAAAGKTTPPAPVDVQPSPSSAFRLEVDAVLAEESAALAALQQRVAAADSRQILELIREIERVKRGTELRLLGVQADFARREGKLEAVARLEEAIRAFEAPSPIRTSPGPRPGDEAPPR